jgi:hypothetical protein
MSLAENRAPTLRLLRRNAITVLLLFLEPMLAIVPSETMSSSHNSEFTRKMAFKKPLNKPLCVLQITHGLFIYTFLRKVGQYACLSCDIVRWAPKLMTLATDSCCLAYLPLLRLFGGLSSSRIQLIGIANCARDPRTVKLSEGHSAFHNLRRSQGRHYTAAFSVEISSLSRR